MTINGEPSSNENLKNFSIANYDLYRYRNNLTMNTELFSNFIQNCIHSSLRTRSPFQSSIMIGGVDMKNGVEVPKLYWMDPYANRTQLSYGCHG
mmetsp:Transcript_25406/g.21284  ORF Transcript_25406/g.21284 Transcript_25406/m.21284 type:complete len:94 (-) Transcript_25406:357-638(-)